MSFMETHDIVAKQVVDAKKEPVPAKAAVDLALAASKVFVARGKKLLEFRVKDGQLQGDSSKADLQKAIVGPSGNLRAPTIRKGKTLFVGYSDELFEKI